MVHKSFKIICNWINSKLLRMYSWTLGADFFPILKPLNHTTKDTYFKLLQGLKIPTVF